MRPFIFITILVTCFGLSGCATFSASPKPATTSDNDPVLQQLSKLHSEIKNMRSEIGQLRQAVTEIHRASVRPPAIAAPAPRAVLRQVGLDDDPIIGNREATVAIVEFTDFECPFCRRFHQQTFGKIEEVYIDTGKIRYIVRDFPLGFHANAKGAAIAANCAEEQVAYWVMYHELFSNQRRLGPELYDELAIALKLDMKAFQTCLKDINQAKEVDSDANYGRSIGIRGTPNFYVGRIEGNQLVEAKQISGAQHFSVFSQAIDALLQ